MQNPENLSFDEEFEFTPKESLWRDLPYLLNKERPEECGFYEQSLNEVTEILKTESGIIELHQNVPTIIVSDIHARPEFLVELLKKELEINGKKAIVFDLLKEGKINIVCVGDALHSVEALNWTEPMLSREMANNLNTMKLIMDLKINFPNYFHFLRGNHEDINSEIKKNEILQTTKAREWLNNNFGDKFIFKWSQFEKKLPIMAKGSNFVVTHAAPNVVHTEQEIALKNCNVFPAFTECENRPDKPDSLREERLYKDIDGNLKNLNMSEDSRWFIGHRTTGENLYRSQLNGRLIQINKDDGYVVAIVPVNDEFNPDKDIIDLYKKKVKN